MSTPRLGQYADVKTILDAALAAGGGRYVLPSHGKAVYWRQRANKFRKAFAEANTASPYEAISFPRLGPEDCTVEIRVLAPEGHFIPRGGAVTPAEDNGLEAAAQALLDKINRGDII